MVLITGAAGFLGSHLVYALMQRPGYEVIALDTSQGFNTGRLDRIEGVRRVIADITQPSLQEAVSDPLDAVVHLAAMAAPRDCDSNPSLAFDVNVNGTNQVLQLALRRGAKKVVFSSSAHVYDIPPRYLPTDENHPLYLGTTYTTTKILGEQLCQLYYNNHGLSYTTLRLFNAYGFVQALGYFIPDQLLKAQRGRIDLQGSNVTKDWVWVADVADAFMRAITTDFVGAVNIGTGVETNLETIAQFIARTYQVELKAIPNDVPTRMCADWRRAKSVLRWHPTVSLEEGLGRLLQLPVGTVAEGT